jgi:hypothetical protein
MLTLFFSYKSNKTVHSKKKKEQSRSIYNCIWKEEMTTINLENHYQVPYVSAVCHCWIYPFTLDGEKENLAIETWRGGCHSTPRRITGAITGSRSSIEFVRSGRCAGATAANVRRAARAATSTRRRPRRRRVAPSISRRARPLLRPATA